MAHGSHHHGAHGHAHGEAQLHASTLVTQRMEHAAKAWLAGLTATQQRQALWPFADAERGDWYYAPRKRNGVSLMELDEHQRPAAYQLLESALSPRGITKAHAIMGLETILFEIERGSGHLRDPLNYAFTVFGAPGVFPWGWRVEGHHLIVNATIAGPADFTILPTFWGTNPAEIRHGPRHGERVQAREYHLGLQLAQTLLPEQRRLAVFADQSIGNIITERGRAQSLLVPTGLAFADLADGQRDLLMTLVEEHVGNAVDAFGVPYLARCRESLDALRFAWAGGMSEGTAFYYRIHGPRLLIELDCTQDNANHIHAIWRDPTNDWGRDLLGEHYQHHHDHD